MVEKKPQDSVQEEQFNSNNQEAVENESNKDVVNPSVVKKKLNVKKSDKKKKEAKDNTNEELSINNNTVSKEVLKPTKVIEKIEDDLQIKLSKENKVIDSEKSDNNHQVVTENQSEHTDIETKNEELVKTTEEKILEKGIEKVSDLPIDKTESKIVQSTKEEKLETRLNIDYSLLTKAELVTEIKQLLGDYPIEKIKDNIENLKIQFYKKHNVDIEKEKKKFINDGGDSEDFHFEADTLETDLKKYLEKFKKSKAEYNQQLLIIEEENLAKKYAIIEEIKDLVNREESFNKTFNEFKDLQQRWHDIGKIPQKYQKNLWNTYNYNVEIFYDYIKINKELKDLDLKKNLKTKINLCEQAEELLLESSVIKAFNSLQKLHDKWRECGPAPQEQKEALWERFKSITSKINKKHQEYFQDQKEIQKENLKAKTLLCEKIEELNTGELKSAKEWDKFSKELVEIQQIWKSIGFASKKDNNKIYQRFRKACDTFFERKRSFFNVYKKDQEYNLQLKTSLCVQAEALQDVTNDWKNTTNEFINIQKKWKEIGSVPKKNSDKIWKRFRKACNYFFENKSKYFASADDRYKENLEKKEDLIKRIKEFTLVNNVKEDLNKLKEFQRQWSEIGFVPNNKKEEIQNKYREILNIKFDNLNIDKKEKNVFKYKSQIEAISSKPNSKQKISYEREKLFSRLKTLENDIIILENNIGFFSNSKNAESMIKSVEDKINKSKEEINFIKTKIDLIDEMEQ